mgnify:CR=1 FL=1
MSFVEVNRGLVTVRQEFLANNLNQTVGEGAPDKELHVRLFRESDSLEVCSWVPTTTALQLVSGDKSDRLTPEILRGWTTKAETSLVVYQHPTHQPVGFCTVSRMELPYLPATYIELCHLVVDPRWRYLFIGSRLYRAVRSAACTLGYYFVCARIVPTNRYALALARFLRAEEFTGTEVWAPSGFRWFRLDISLDND